MNLSQYEVFIKTVEEGSLTKAAEKMGYTQSGVTHMLKALEDRLGLKLLERGRKGTVLTAEGEILLPYIRDVVNQQRIVEETVNKLKGMETGYIRIGTFTSVSSHCLPGMIRTFQEKYPNIRFELLHGTNKDNEEWVKAGVVDLAFVKLPASETLETIFLMRDPLVAVVSEENDHAERGVMPLDIFIQLPYIELSEGVDDEITEYFRNHNVYPQTRFTERDDYAVMAMVEQDLGVSLMPELVLKGSPRRIKALPMEPPAYRELGIAYRNSVSSAAAEFIKCACEWNYRNSKNSSGV